MGARRTEKITSIARDVTVRLCREATTPEDRVAVLEAVVTATLCLNEQEHGLLRHQTLIHLGLLSGLTLQRFTTGRRHEG